MDVQLTSDQKVFARRAVLCPPNVESGRLHGEEEVVLEAPGHGKTENAGT